MRALLLGLLASCCPAPAVAAPPPVTSFTNFPIYESMKISRKGTFIAFTRDTTEHELMTVLRLKDMEATTQSHFGDRIDIASFEWANDSRLLISPTRRFPGLHAFKAPTGEIIGLEADGKDAELLFGYQAGIKQTGTRIRERESIYAAAEVLATLPANTAEVLIQTFGYSYQGDFNSVYRMNVKTGMLQKIAGSPLRDGIFLPDLERRVRLVSGEDREGNNQVFYRAVDSVAWQRLASTAMGEGMLWPVAPTGRKDEFYVLDDRDAPTRGVFAWTPETDTERLLFRHPDVDLSLAGVDPSGKPWGFEYDDNFPRYWYPDPEHPLAQLHKWLCTTFPDQEVEITSQTDDMSRVVARISGPRSPPIYYVVDVPGRKLLHQLSSRPDLKPENLAAVEPIEFTARDGMKIRGFLTMPNGSRTKQLPMIVVVHGGPHGVYDRFEFDYETQLLASRGYVVLQVNYRGSGGRGHAFESAGYRKWGHEMQDDVTDGVKWAIGDGVADPKRICIYGASYGAYAALTGAFREPGLFRCAVGMAGVYDLSLMLTKGDIQTSASGKNYLDLALGTDKEELKRRSPVYNAGNIRIPVLLLHGKVDDRAPFEHAKRMRDALKDAGNPPEWSTEWGEGHGFFDEANRAAAYGRMLEFFAKNLGPADGA